MEYHGKKVEFFSLESEKELVSYDDSIEEFEKANKSENCPDRVLTY